MLYDNDGLPYGPRHKAKEISLDMSDDIFRAQMRDFWKWCSEGWRATD